MSHVEDDWYYLDSTDQEFGPFPSSTMAEWYSQGFFPIQLQLRVRTTSMKEHCALGQCYPKGTTPFVGPPKTPNRRSGGGGGNRMNRGSNGGSNSPHMYASQHVEEMMPPPYPSVVGGAPPLPQQFGGCGQQQYWMMPPAPSPYGAPAPSPAFPFNQYGASPGGGRFQGRIKSFNAKQGFGFIECPQAHSIFGRDIFLHKAQIGDFKVGMEVTFGVEPNKQGMPQARDIMGLDGQTPGPMQNPMQGGFNAGGYGGPSGGNFGGGFCGGKGFGNKGGKGGKGKGKGGGRKGGFGQGQQ